MRGNGYLVLQNHDRIGTLGSSISASRNRECLLLAPLQCCNSNEPEEMQFDGTITTLFFRWNRLRVSE